jgi:hypothetical protein
MMRVNGYPLYQLGLQLGVVIALFDSTRTPRAELLKKLAEARPYLEFAGGKPAADGTVSVLPSDSKAAANGLIAVMDAIANKESAPDLPPVDNLEHANLVNALMWFNNILARDLWWFDLYWLQPKLGYATADLLKDATVIFPESIRGAITDRIKYEVQQAANCLLYEAPSAVGFHILRAVEMVIIDYFTIPTFERAGANSWTDYSKRLRSYKVHRKIVGMIDRLAGLHRNELMHAEAVLSVEESAILFALMQEVLPVMIADIARRKGAPIVNFPIFDDLRWQN